MFYIRIMYHYLPLYGYHIERYTLENVGIFSSEDKALDYGNARIAEYKKQSDPGDNVRFSFNVYPITIIQE